MGSPSRQLKTSPSATVEEAAAIAAALARFMADTTPTRAPGGAAEADHWRRAALLEGVARDPWELAPGPASTASWINT